MTQRSIDTIQELGVVIAGAILVVSLIIGMVLSQAIYPKTKLEVKGFWQNTVTVEQLQPTANPQTTINGKALND